MTVLKNSNVNKKTSLKHLAAACLLAGSGAMVQAESTSYVTEQCSASTASGVYDFYPGTEFESGVSPTLNPYSGPELAGYGDGDLVKMRAVLLMSRRLR